MANATSNASEENWLHTDAYMPTDRRSQKAFHYYIDYLIYVASASNKMQQLESKPFHLQSATFSFDNCLKFDLEKARSLRQEDVFEKEI